MKRILIGLTAAAALCGCASMGSGGASAAAAPQPSKPVDAASFYTGVWHEIARNPMKLTDGCVAGVTKFYKDDSSRLIDRDSCNKDTPTGKEKVFAGPVTILDPSTNAKFHTDYKVFGVFTVGRDYWILDHGEDWFIVASPSFKDLSVFTRSPQPGKARIDELVGKAKALGYDVSKLEYPAQPAS
jgi:apolipoprotein D and lipocalin family protein